MDLCDDGYERFSCSSFNSNSLGPIAWFGYFSRFLLPGPFFCDDTWTERSFYHVNRVTIPQNFKAESSAENFVGIRVLIKTQQTIL